MRKDARRHSLTRAALVIVSAVVLAYLGLRTLTTDTPGAEAALPVIEEPSAPDAPPPETGGGQNGFVLRETMRLDEIPTALAFTRDGGTLAAGLADGRVRTWDTATGERLVDLSGPQSKIAAVTVAAPAGRVAAVDADGGAYVWDASGQAASALQESLTGRFLRFSDDGRRLAVVADDGSVHVREMESNRRWSFPGVAKRVPRALAFSPTGPLMAVSGDREIALWGVGLSDKRETLPASGPEAEAIAFSANGLEMAAGIGPRVIAWDLPTRRRSHTYSLSGTVRALAYAGDDGWIAVTDDAKHERLWVWQVNKRRKITSIRMAEPAVAITLSSSGDRLSAATAKGEVHYWDSLPSTNR